jgi:hypothetical protein
MWGRTKEDDQESEDKKSGRRLHFPLPVPTACRDVGKRISTQRPSESAISREPSIEHLINQNAANLAAT